MALYKEIQTPIGITLTYWRIKEFSFNNVDKRGHIIVVPYISKASRDAGNDYVREESKKISVFDHDYSAQKGYEQNTILNYSNYFAPDKAFTVEGLYAAMYRYIKENAPDFEGAEDI